MDMNEVRVYDPRCDDADVALRCVAQAIEKDKWRCFESNDLDYEAARGKVQELTDSYGSMYSRRWHDPQMMRLLRRRLPELIPIAESWRVLYVLVTLHERKTRKGRVA